MKLKYLVAGTGRCGTVYLARFLTSLGISCGHEAIFDHNGIDGAIRRLNGDDKVNLSYTSQNEFKSGKWNVIPAWVDVDKIEAESSYMAVPYLSHEVFKDTKVIHVVRNPLNVIHSFCNYIEYFSSPVPTNMYENFIYTQLPELKENLSRYDRAALFYVRWNEMIEKANPDRFFRIEDDPSSLLEFLGKSGDYFKEGNVNSFRKSCREKFTFSKLERPDIRRSLSDMAKRYGYQIESEYLLL